MSGEPVNQWDEFAANEDDPEAMRRYKNSLCDTALAYYDQGADGLSTFNWNLSNLSSHGRFGQGAQKISVYIFPKLGDPQALREYRDQDWVLPEGFNW